MDDKDKRIELMALWEQTSRAGNTYLTGKLGSARIIAFRTTNKRNDREPDWRIYVEAPKPREEAAPATTEEVPF